MQQRQKPVVVWKQYAVDSCTVKCKQRSCYRTADCQSLLSYPSNRLLYCEIMMQGDGVDKRTTRYLNLSKFII